MDDSNTIKTVKKAQPKTALIKKERWLTNMGKSVELRSKKGKSRQNSPEWIIMYLKD